MLMGRLYRPYQSGCCTTGCCCAAARCQLAIIRRLVGKMVSEIDHLLTWEGALAEAMAWSPGLPPWRREDHHRKRLKLCTHRRGSLGFRQLNVFGNRKASTLISTGNDREATLGELARLILALERSNPVRVDGRTASGKTTFADELGVVVAQRNREVIRTSIDGFHRPRAERYARGRYSPEGTTSTPGISVRSGDCCSIRWDQVAGANIARRHLIWNVTQQSNKRP